MFNTIQVYISMLRALNLYSNSRPNKYTFNRLIDIRMSWERFQFKKLNPWQHEFVKRLQYFYEDCLRPFKLSHFFSKRDPRHTFVKGNWITLSYVQSLFNIYRYNDSYYAQVEKERKWREFFKNLNDTQVYNERKLHEFFKNLNYKKTIFNAYRASKRN